jgi:hypothetical protein
MNKIIILAILVTLTMTLTGCGNTDPRMSLELDQIANGQLQYGQCGGLDLKYLAEPVISKLKSLNLPANIILSKTDKNNDLYDIVEVVTEAK